MFTRIKTADAIEWSDESLFQGVLVLVIKLPVGYKKVYSRFSSSLQTMRRPLPLRIVIPIYNGVLQNNLVLSTTELSPPNTRYLAKWFSEDNVQIGDDSALFSISNEQEYEITVPELTVPEAPS